MKQTPRDLRQTGRTTRMLARARELAFVANKAVYVIAGSEREARRLEIECRAPHSMGIKFETPETMPNFDFSTMTLRGAHPNCVVLVDHYAIESRYARMLEALHAFDE